MEFNKNGKIISVIEARYLQVGGETYESDVAIPVPLEGNSVKIQDVPK